MAAKAKKTSSPKCAKAKCAKKSVTKAVAKSTPVKTSDKIARGAKVARAKGVYRTHEMKGQKIEFSVKKHEDSGKKVVSVHGVKMSGDDGIIHQRIIGKADQTKVKAHISRNNDFVRGLKADENFHGFAFVTSRS